MRAARALITIAVLSFLLRPDTALALDPSLEVSQYDHTAWTARDGFSVGAIFAMAQTPDGYLWLGSEFGLYRFDGVKPVVWQPPTGQQLPNKPYALLVTRDGTLWIGTFEGLVSWDGGKLTYYPEIGKEFVTSLLEDHEGAVWVGTYGSRDLPARVCAIRTGSVQCKGKDGSFGSFVWSLGEDSSGTLWAGADSGVWRCNPGPAKRYAMPGMRVGDLLKSDDGRLLIGISGAGLRRPVADKLEPYPVYSAMNRNALLADREVDSNKLLRDRDGGLWIGTHQRGLIHVHNGRTDVFTKSDGLSGDISCSLFEDREGNVWFASSRGLDRFRELPVATISTKQGLSSSYLSSLVAGADGSVWVGTHDGLTMWKNGHSTIFRKANGLPDNFVNSLFMDNRGRVWASFSGHRLSYFKDGSFVSVAGVPSEEVYCIAGDDKDNLWLSGNKGLSHLRDGHLVEHFPWSAMGRHQQAKVLAPNEGGVWLAFWAEGGVFYFKDGQVRASFTTANGLGKGHVAGIRLDRDGPLWAATQEGGLSRIKDGHVDTLSTNNGLPCDTIHWSIEDDDRSLWLYTACGLLRIARTELDAWIADPKHRVETTLWDAADGVRLASTSPAYFNPPVAKSTDGKLWFLGGEGASVVDPHHLAFNKVPPPVHIEQIIADNKVQWQNLPGGAASNLRLPSRIRDLEIDYAALSLVAPEKMRFRVMLEGQDKDWRVPVNSRRAHYTNLPPGPYRFRVVASNNSGVWNDQGDTLEFSVDPAYYQTNWFRALCVATVMALLWAAYQLRVRQLRREFNTAIEARVSERTRIARELHDTLLQSLQALLFQYQAARNLFAAGSERAMQVLDASLDRTEQAIAESRDAIRDIRSDVVAQNALPELLTTAGSELAQSQADQDVPTFGLTVEGERRTLTPVIREETYRIALELLRNAFRHAKAHRIETEIRYDDDMLRLRIRDDGKGMDLKVLQGDGSGHWGLRGIRERAQRIGAKLDVWSEAGAGAEFQLTVPGGIAYVGSGDSLPFRLLRKVKGYAYRN
jgi:signal transduction histidine kinase/ligand-binding sensor domain-containing protein